MRRGGLWVRSHRTGKRHDSRDKTRNFKCSRLEIFQGHVSGFHLMFTVLIPGDEWVSNRLFIVIPFDGHLSGPTARVMIMISYLTVMQMLPHNARKQTVMVMIFRA
jgi:hypothetical protein